MRKGIYRLFAIKTNTTFYIGRSLNVQRRKQEHIYNAAHGHKELKYDYIRQLTNAGVEWDIEIVNSDLQAEDFEVYKCLIDMQPLTNMVKGSVYTEVENGAHYSSVTEYNAGVEYREKVTEARKAHALSLKAYTNKKPRQQPGESATMGSTKPPATISSGLAALRARRGK